MVIDGWFKLFFAVCWTLFCFLGGLISGAPIGEVILIASFIAFITGLVHFVCVLIVRAQAKY